MQELDFMLQHPSRLVEDYDKPRGRDCFTITSLDYSGDHPVCRRTSEEDKNVPQKNDLYILQNGTQWISLYPFVSVHTCSACEARETFFLDGLWTDSKRLKLKSFERAHRIPHAPSDADAEVNKLAPVAEAFTNWLRTE